MIIPTISTISDLRQLLEIRDDSGRNIKIRRINALDRLRLLKVAGRELSQNEAWLNMAVLTLAVVEIDGVPRVMPTTERQIESAVMELCDNGLRAIAEALDENEKAQSLFDGSPEGNPVGTPN